MKLSLSTCFECDHHISGKENHKTQMNFLKKNSSRRRKNASDKTKWMCLSCNHALECIVYSKQLHQNHTHATKRCQRLFLIYLKSIKANMQTKLDKSKSYKTSWQKPYHFNPSDTHRTRHYTTRSIIFNWIWMFETFLKKKKEHSIR